jgi:hypothetical protein
MKLMSIRDAVSLNNLWYLKTGYIAYLVDMMMNRIFLNVSLFH